MDVENWNLCISQIQDSILINTAILLGRAKLSKGSLGPEDDNQPKESTVSSLHEAYKGAVSVKDLLSNGPGNFVRILVRQCNANIPSSSGYMAELVSHSLCQMNIPPVCVRERESDGSSDWGLKRLKLNDGQKDLISKSIVLV